MFACDLHIHSKYSRATSRDCDAPHLDMMARRKGLALIGTGDLTHPAWRAELGEAITEAGEGVYALRSGLRLPCGALGGDGAEVRFVLSGEISTIFKRDGKTRKVHSVILLPSLKAAERLSARLERIGNIRSDGRPILGLDCRDLLEIALDTCPQAIFIPAHIWTPHFSALGAFSGFDSIAECFGDMAPHVTALETGLSSDPPMNRRLSALDGYLLTSASDAHSPARLGREASLIEGEADLPTLRRALATGEGFCGTLEMFPEEGKYHLDGHRACHARLTPQETQALGGKCPVCGRRVTVGVEHRVCQLADRAEPGRCALERPFEYLVPLEELVASAMGSGGKRARAAYERLLTGLGPELDVLRHAPTQAIARLSDGRVAEAVRRLRAGQVQRLAGYDGEYGSVSFFTQGEAERFSGQTSLLMPVQAALGGAAALDGAVLQVQAEAPQEQAADRREGLDEAQRAAVGSVARVTAVVAGPGTGKTRTLVERIAWIIEHGAPPQEITAVTFTNKAADELRQRLAGRLGAAADGVNVGTFHAICLRLLPPKRLLGGDEALHMVAGLLRERGCDMRPADAAAGISRAKCGEPCADAGVERELPEAYAARLKELGARDMDDLLLDALALGVPQGERRFRWLAVDEFQDINALQRRLVRAWCGSDGSLFAIGDPDQSIYGFRGASAACFDELERDYPGLCRLSLTRGYRSTPQVLGAALAVLGGRPMTAVRPDGAPVRAVSTPSPGAEADWIAAEIARMAGGVDMNSAGELERARGELRAFSDIAVLCRTHRQLDIIEAALVRAGIPCVVSGRGGELDDPSVRAAAAFLRCICASNDANLRGEYLRLAPGQTAPEDILRELAESSVRASKESPALLAARWAAMHGGGEAMERFCRIAGRYASLPALLSALAIGEEADISRASGREYAAGAVSLMTLHAAKGLEFPAVFLAGVSRGALPLERAEGGVDICEERRLMFVGMTRARDELSISWSGEPSPFVGELPDSTVSIRVPPRAPKALQLTMF